MGREFSVQQPSWGRAWGKCHPHSLAMFHFSPSLWLSSVKPTSHPSSSAAGHFPVPWWGLFYWTTTVHGRARRWRRTEQTTYRLSAQHPAQRALNGKACVWYPRYFLPALTEPPTSVRWVSDNTTNTYLFHKLQTATVYIVIYSVFERGRYFLWHRCGSYREV